MSDRAGSALKLAVWVILVTSVACGSVAPGLVQAPEQDFTIAVGKSVRIQGTNLVVRFEGVLNDSRCPNDVQCITAGDATVLVTVSTGGAAASRYELHTDDGTREAVHGEYRVTLVALNPVPVSTRPVRASDYVVTIRITKP